MITYDFAQQFEGSHLACTLDVSYVSDKSPLPESDVHTRMHESGWTITGKVHEDYYAWVNSFTAYHPDYGFVSGDFESQVVASSQEGYDDFVKHHPPQNWDYWDI